MSRKKTHDEYVREVFIKNPNIDVVGSYINSGKKITHKCKVCGHTWEALPCNILKGSGCPQCTNNKRSIDRAFTKDEYIDKLAQINPYIEFIGDYKNSNTKSMHLCKICGYQWMAYPSNVLRGKGCKKCSDIRIAAIRKKSHDDYVSQVMSVNTNIVVLDKYINARMPIKHQCRMCGYEWYVSPDNILGGHGCPRCMKSNGEKMVQEYLTIHSIQFEPQYVFLDCKNKKVLPFDFYIPSLNACIEYDGIQHFEPIEHFGGIDAFKKRQQNDTIKNNYCLSHKINLLRIKYDQDVNNELDNFFYNIKLTEEAV